MPNFQKHIIYFIYLFIYLKVRTILDPMCCKDTLSYNTLHRAVASGVAATQSARR